MKTARTPARVAVHVRWMIRRDMPEVLGIEAAGFAFPWGEDKLVGLLRRRDCIGMVAEHGEAVVGYMVYLLRPRHVRVLALAAHPEYRRAGVGRQLVAKLAAKLSPRRRTRLTLRVRETDLAAQQFFRSQGFRAEAVRRGHYAADTGEDAYEMAYDLDATPPPPGP